MYQTFYPLSRHWITKIIGVLFWLMVLGFVASQGIFPCAVGPLVFLVWSLFDLNLLKHTVLRLDEQSLRFQRGKSVSQILWKDVLMVRQVKQPWNRRLPLELATQDQDLSVPLDFFDAAQVWYWIKRYAPVEALRDDAYRRLPAYQAWLVKAEDLISNSSEPLRVNHTLGTKFMAVSVLVLFASIGYLSWLIVNPVVASLFFGPIILFLANWAISSIFYQLEMTSEGITVTSLWKKQQMRWDEVQYIEHDFGQHRFVFYGQNKRLAITGPKYLAGRDQSEMLNMLQAQIQYRKLELLHKERALFTWSRNVSVPLTN